MEKGTIPWQTRTVKAQFATREENGKKFIDCQFATFEGVYEIFPGCTESVDPGAFDGQLGGDVRCLVDHLTHLVLGRTTAGTLTLWTDERGLHGTVEINENDQDALNLYARVQRGDVTQCSFGFDTLEERHEVLPDGSVHYTLMKVRLYEVSIVTFPAYQDTSAASRAADVQAIRARRADAWKTQMKERLAKWR